MMTTEQMRAEVLQFAAQYDTPAVREMVRLAEAGRIEWAGAYGLATRALAEALAEVPA
jgi:hypothetical protein